MDGRPMAIVTTESSQNELSVATSDLHLNTNQARPSSSSNQSSAQPSGSATGNPRNKCALRPGHSLMDWVRLGSNSDLAGTRGIKRPVSHEELSKHNMVDDAWLAIRGKVYNVTRYMDFHPGGVDELMKGIGRDATKMFDDVHAWVNYEQLLLKCFIGPLQNTTSISLSQTLGVKQLASLTGPNGCFKAPFLPIFSMSTNQSVSKFDENAKKCGDERVEIVPRYDWIQKSNELTLVFYTKPMCNAGVIVRCTSDSNTNYDIIIQIDYTLHTFTFNLIEAVDFPPINTKVNYETGKIEVVFRKSKQELWTNFGLLSRDKLTDLANVNSLYDVIDRVQITHDSYAIVLEPSSHRQLQVLPIGFHISVTVIIDGESVTRSLTPIPKTFMPISEHPTDQRLHLYFLVKRYANAKLSPFITNDTPLPKELVVSCAKGNFSINTLAEHSRIAMVAAGSGLTPMLPLIHFLLQRRNHRLEKMNLLYFNKTEQDIWCKDELAAIAEKDERFNVQHFFSREPTDDANTKPKKISKTLASRLFDAASDIHSTYCLICGPTAFNDCCINLFRSVGYDTDQMFAFGS